MARNTPGLPVMVVVFIAFHTHPHSMAIAVFSYPFRADRETINRVRPVFTTIFKQPGARVSKHLQRAYINPEGQTWIYLWVKKVPQVAQNGQWSYRMCFMPNNKSHKNSSLMWALRLNINYLTSLECSLEEYGYTVVPCDVLLSLMVGNGIGKLLITDLSDIRPG